MPELPEELKNCGHCKKPVMRAKRYYRNGKYYCNQNHYRAAVEKAKEEAAAAAQEAAEGAES